MWTLLCVLMLFSAQIHLIAQVNPGEEIVGIWKVKKAYETFDSVPGNVQAAASRLRKDLLGSTFQFSADHYVTFLCQKQKKLSFQAANWITAGDPDKIIIQNWPIERKPVAEIMKIAFMTENGKTIFLIDDLFGLEMERVIVKKERH
jgi:hypothetical protein